VPIFCPGIGLRKPIDIDTLNIEMQQADGSWKALPTHRELPALDKVKIGAHEEYDNEFALENPYPVSQWMSFPRKPYSIPLRGKLRLSVGYFVSEKEWENYVSALMRNERASAARGGSFGPNREAHSEPFTLSEVAVMRLRRLLLYTTNSSGVDTYRKAGGCFGKNFDVSPKTVSHGIRVKLICQL
jgi:hypothetical protein